jgi:hypothetical protein
VADKLGTKRLLIVADGPLQHIPFQVLALPDETDPSASSSKVTANQPRPLISDHEIINEPSASILALVLSESANREPRSNSVAVLLIRFSNPMTPELHLPEDPAQTQTQGKARKLNSTRHCEM